MYGMQSQKMSSCILFKRYTETILLILIFGLHDQEPPEQVQVCAGSDDSDKEKKNTTKMVKDELQVCQCNIYYLQIKYKKC